MDVLPFNFGSHDRALHRREDSRFLGEVRAAGAGYLGDHTTPGSTRRLPLGPFLPSADQACVIPPRLTVSVRGLSPVSYRTVR